MGERACKEAWQGFHFQNKMPPSETKDHVYNVAQLLPWAAETRRRKGCPRGHGNSQPRALPASGDLATLSMFPGPENFSLVRVMGNRTATGPGPSLGLFKDASGRLRPLGPPGEERRL